MNAGFFSAIENKFPKYAAWFAVYLFIYLLVNLYVLVRPSFHWDEILDWCGQATDTYLVAGRWGCYAYRTLLGEGCFPIVAGLMAGVYISLAIILHTHMLRLHGVLEKLVYAFVYVACNQWASQLVYAFLADAVALGLLFATLSVYALVCCKRVTIAVVFLVLAMGMYQSVALYFGVLWAAVSLSQNETELKQLIRFILVSCGGVIGYFVVQKLCMLLIPVPQETIDYVTGYQATTSNWPLALKSPLYTKFLCAQFYFRQSLAHACGFGEYLNLVTASAMIPMVLLVVRYARSGACAVAKICKIALVLIIWYSPFVFTFLMLGFPGERVWVAAPVSVAALWVLFLKEYSVSRRVWAVVAILALTMVFKATYSNGVNARKEAYEYHTSIDQLKLIHAEARIMAIEADIDSPEIILISNVSGKCHSNAYLLPHAFQSGVISWYADHYHLGSLRWALDSEMPAYSHLLTALPEWPHPKSMTIVNGNVVVKVVKAPRSK